MDFSSIPHGPTDAPVAGPTDRLVFDIDEIDGPMHMFEHQSSGCVMVSFSKPISKGGYGKAWVDGKLLRQGTFTSTLYSGDFPILCLPVRGVLNTYDTTATLRLEGFIDVDGLMMQPQEMQITVLPRKNAYLPEYAAHDLVALEAAREAVVLLCNNGVLPLEQDAKINLFGRGVAEYRAYPSGAGKINPRHLKSLLQAIGECSRLQSNAALEAFYRCPSNDMPPDALLKEAQAFSDTAVMILTRGSGENIDNRPCAGEYYLSADELNLLQALRQRFPRLIVVLNVAYPVSMAWEAQIAPDAVVYSGLNGMQGAQALLEVLDGRVCPSGKLPDTWPLDYHDLPASVNFFNPSENEKPLQTDAPVYADMGYEEGLCVGYRYFETFRRPVAYGFGHGLSYTRFGLKDAQTQWTGEALQLSLRVKNEGAVAGKTVAQWYVQIPAGKLWQPAKRLIAFEKTALLPLGAAVQVDCTVAVKWLASYDEEQAAWVMERGEYRLFVGESLATAQPCGSFTLAEDRIVWQVRPCMVFPLPFTEMNPEKPWPVGGFAKLRPDAMGIETSPRRDRMIPAGKAAPEQALTYQDVQRNPSLLPQFVAGLTDAELCRLSVCCNRGWSMENRGEAGWLYPIGHGIPTLAAADGNNGLNLQKPNIGMPTSAMLCATFNKEMAYQVGLVIAQEAVENGIGLLLAPSMNLHRNPLNGRHPEYFSEDPLLSGQMAGWQCKGFQDTGVMGCYKHVAANSCEAVRKRSHSIMGQRTLRELYLRTFEAAMDVEKADTIMTGYNALNGSFCAEDTELLEDIFRGEFGFDGFAMTDWNSYDTVDMIKALNAGISWLTPGSDDDARVMPLLQAMEQGKLTRVTLQENVRRMLAMLLRRGV